MNGDDKWHPPGVCPGIPPVASSDCRLLTIEFAVLSHVERYLHDRRFDAITSSTPLRLTVAARLAFPDGSISVRTLRLEASRGRLVIERIGNKDFTTLAAIEAMREMCRVPPNPRASTCVNERAERPAMSSSTVDVKSARALASRTSEALKKRSAAI